VGNPEFAIIDEAYPYISKRLMTDESPRLKAAFRYMVYGQSDVLGMLILFFLLLCFYLFLIYY
jgi:aarF domain-containing kinase